MIEKEIIKTPYGAIAAYKKGTGTKTVLLLHGAGCDSTMLSWKEVFDRFTEDCTVYAFDFWATAAAIKRMILWEINIMIRTLRALKLLSIIMASSILS